jgi:ubiquinone biosynthesis accessory factor UbiK
MTLIDAPADRCAAHRSERSHRRDYLADSTGIEDRQSQLEGTLMADKPGSFNIDDLARQLAQSLPKNLRALGGDLERNFKAMLQSGLERMDLVTREEFDVQSAVLERTREKLEVIETRLAELERDLAARSEST